MASMIQVTCFVLVCLFASCAAWGNTGHQTVAAVAQALLTRKANDYVTNVLGGATMESVATWADDIRREHQWSWSAPLHYIDTPDFLCSFEYSRDCQANGVPDFCVAGAITNFTKQVTSVTQSRVQLKLLEVKNRHNLKMLNDVDAASALKFVIHFVGDIHQPLHVGFTTDRGGNEIYVYYYNKHENLHAVWDEYIINTMLTNFYSGSADSWVSALTQAITTGNYSRQASTWAACNTASEECTTAWAKESIMYACQTSYECVAGSKPCSSQQVTEGVHLDDDYFNQAYPVVNLRIAQAAVRLAATLNYIFS